MTAILLVLALLIFGVGVVAWGVHMHAVWAGEAARSTPRGLPSSSRPRVSRLAPGPAVIPDRSGVDPFAHVADTPLKDVRP